MSDTPICEFYSDTDKINVTAMLNRGENRQLLLHSIDLTAYKDSIEIKFDKSIGLDKVIEPGENIIGAYIDFIEARLYRANDPNNYYQFIAQDLHIQGIGNAYKPLSNRIRLEAIDDTLPIRMCLRYIRERSTNANSKASDSNNR